LRGPASAQRLSLASFHDAFSRPNNPAKKISVYFYLLEEQFGECDAGV